MTSLAGLILVAYCFKFAKMAGINQGCLPCIFSMTIFYVSVLFYFKFGEKISMMKIVGTLLMIPCIVFLSLGGGPGGESSDETSQDEYSDSQKQVFAVISVIFAMSAPFFWTTKMLYLRKSEGEFGFNLFDIAIDAQIYMNIVATGLYIAYIVQDEFKASELLEGSIVAIFFILGDIFRSMAFRYGPGGPINALVGTQVIYQTLVNALFFDQPLGAYQYYGITAGVLATIIISTGDEMLDLCRAKPNKDSNASDGKKSLLEEPLANTLETKQ
mmetsp:Transcript_31507/g.41716  ORF Transcript_31507/g.41716 Transcript_31507/m.41716 type:complete len:272 (+) Transcript_31507:253-1068(+)